MTLKSRGVLFKKGEEKWKSSVAMLLLLSLMVAMAVAY